jgi:hypothetical protein
MKAEPAALSAAAVLLLALGAPADGIIGPDTWRCLHAFDR